MPLTDVQAVESAIVELANSFRRQNTLQDVRTSAALTATARAYAAFLASTNLFSHTADGLQPSDRAMRQGYAACMVSENIAMHASVKGFESRDLAQRAMDGWIQSPAHRANLLARDATETGVGVARAPGDTPKYISVQLFARPQSLKYSFRIANVASVPVTYTFGGKTRNVAPRMTVTHTSCMPDIVTFEKAGSRTLTARFTASDRTVYTLKGDEASGVSVVLSHRSD